MAKYQKYAEYKESGVQWIGEIPDDWKFLRGKWKFNTLKEVNRDLQCMDRLALTMNGVIERSIDSDEGLQPAEFSGYQIFEKNDLVFKLIDLENFKTSRVGLVFKRGIMSPAYIRLRPLQGTYSRFFYYFYFDLYLRGVYNQIGGQGVRSALNATDLLEIEICVPALEEQIQIANFLDHETAKIDTLIAKQEKLIELLKEKRQAVISHAVTKGLNPNVPMKDSGVEWLGEVPKHWAVTKVGFHTLKIGSGKTPKGGAEIYQDEGVLFIRSQNVYNEGLRIDSSESTYISEAIHDDMSTSKVYSGDILLNITGGSIGRSSIVPDEFPEANVNQHVCIIRVRKYLQKFLALVIQSDLIQAQIQSIQTGGNREGLNFEQISKFYFALPSTEEQKQLIKYIEDKVLEFSKLEVKASNAIQLMQERRTALISAAVTGKIDVRHWQHPNQKNNNNTELSA